MKNEKKYPPGFARCLMLAGLILVPLMAAPVCAAQQNPPQLQVASPVDGSAVKPAQSISVAVTSPANVAF